MLIKFAILYFFISFVYLDPITEDALQGTWISRGCENIFGLAYITREFQFFNNEWQITVLNYATNRCNFPIGSTFISGDYSLLDSEFVSFTTVTNGDFRISEKTFTPFVDEFTDFYNSLSDCFPPNTFTTGVTTDILEYSCPELGIESESECENGERDIVALYDNDLFFGDRFLGAPMCDLPRPPLLASFGLRRINEANILEIPSTATHSNEISDIINQVSISNMREIVQEMSSYFTRYYSTQTGVDAAHYLFEKYSQVAACSSIASVTLFSNEDIEPGFLQPSIRARIEGKTDNNIVVVIGGHIDSANFFDPITNQSTFTTTGEDPRWGTLRAPGADDDISGSSLIFEVFRILVESGFEPDRSLEFLAFAGEEKGIVDGQVTGKAGSALLARFYRENGIEIAAMYNFDSIGIPYVSGCNPFNIEPNTIGIFGDPNDPTTPNIDPFITDLFEDCVNTYAESPYSPLLVSNGQSDHLSFIDLNLPAGGCVESGIGASGLELCGFEEQVHHTDRDFIENIDFDYLKQFTRSTIGFMVEASFTPATVSNSVSFNPQDCSDSYSTFTYSNTNTFTDSNTNTNSNTNFISLDDDNDSSSQSSTSQGNILSFSIILVVIIIVLVF